MKQEATQVQRAPQFRELFIDQFDRLRVGELGAWNRNREYRGYIEGVTRRSARRIARRRARTQMRLDRSVPLERLVTLA